MTGGPRRLYFDHNASAPLLPAAREAMLDAMAGPANPSAVHAEGRRARALVETARRSVAALVGGEDESVIFTGGASEAANTLLSPRWQRGDADLTITRLLVADTDHPCLREGGRFAPEDVTRLPVDRHGHLRIDMLEDALAHDNGGTTMVALTLANNESGVVQPLGPVREVLRGRAGLLVVDAVQAAGRMPFAIKEIGADAVILSGHKIGAPIGVGAYVLRDPTLRPAPLILGGGQERRHRAGTQAAPLIAAFGAAAGVAHRRTPGEVARMHDLRDRLETRLAAAGEVVVLGRDVERLANTVFFAASGLNAETAQIALDLQGFAVSAGSACASGKVAASRVLTAHAQGGLGIDPAGGAIRISFGFETTIAEIDAIGTAVAIMIERAGLSSRESRVA